MAQNTYNLCLRHKSLHFKSLIFLFTNIVINFKTPKCFISNAFAFSPKRKYVSLQMHLRLKQNVLAFSGPCLKALQKPFSGLIFRFFLLDRFVFLYRCRKNLPVTDGILQYFDSFFQISIIFQAFHHSTTLIEIAGHDFL